MTSSGLLRSWIRSAGLWLPSEVLAMAIAFALSTVAVPLAQAQTYQVLYNFADGPAGGIPFAGLTMDKAGNFYGTAATGGTENWGTAFKLARKGSGWVLAPIHQFGEFDAITPLSRVVFGPDGSLYGTTFNEGQAGTAYKLTPPATACKSALCYWTSTVLHFFQAGSGDGFAPKYGDLTLDAAGNVYGTAPWGGAYGWGMVYELSPSSGGWVETVLYNFTGGSDGGEPYAGVIFDSKGNLYGTTFAGGNRNAGVVFELAPSGYGWTENVLYRFDPNGSNNAPIGGLIFDQAGNLYGTTTNSVGGSGSGAVFMLSPYNGQWTLTVLYAIPGIAGFGPVAGLLMDSTGNLYGTTYRAGAYGWGSVFKLVPGSGGWTPIVLHDFAGGSDGFEINGGVAMDSNGNLYGTASYGGAYNYGLVWEITP